MNGKTFLSTDVQGVVLVPGTRIRLTFKDGNLSAQGGCNSMGGAYTIAGDRLTATQMFMTEMGCDEPRMQQDEWLARLLGGATIGLVGDTLTLDDGTVRLTMVDREVASPDKPIEGTRWLLDGIVSGDAVSSVPAGVTASLRIVGGRAEVEAGCNTGGGTVAVSADTLTFGPLALTKKACEPAAMAVERAVTAVLSRGSPLHDRGGRPYPRRRQRRPDVPRRAVAVAASVTPSASTSRRDPARPATRCRSARRRGSPSGAARPLPVFVNPCASPGGLTTTWPPSTTTV